MSPDRIRTFLNEEPFQPFTVVTGDGSEVDVLAREYVSLYPGGRTMLVFVPAEAKSKDEEPDVEEHRIDVFLITKVIRPIPKRKKPRRRAG